MTAPERTGQTLGLWTVNGKTQFGYRIDAIHNDMPTGLDLLLHPTAIVPKLEDAEHIVATVNAAPATAALLNEALGVVEECLDQLEWYQKDHANDDQYAGRIEKARTLLARAKAVEP